MKNDIGTTQTPQDQPFGNVSGELIELLTEGWRVKFKREKQAYTIQATSRRFTVCSKPFNAKKTTLYTIIDWQEGVRGPENVVFGLGAETQLQCFQMLVRLLDGETEVSHRHRIPLDIEWIKDNAGKDLQESMKLIETLSNKLRPSQAGGSDVK